MDWDKEVDNLSKGLDFLKLGSGSHKIRFLNEGTEKVVTWEGKEYQKVFFDVEFEGRQHVWSVTKGGTYQSLYGQVALIGRFHGQLTGTEVTLIVKGEGKNRDYTILEALDLIRKQVEINSSNNIKEEQVS